MQANDSCRATVSDVSATAVSNLKSQAESMGLSDERLHAYVSDATDVDNFARLSAPHIQAFGQADVALLVFTLSAIPPSSMAAALQSAWAHLRPGGCLLLRDYGKFDMTALRFPPEQRLADGLYYRYVFAAGWHIR